MRTLLIVPAPMTKGTVHEITTAEDFESTFGVSLSSDNWLRKVIERAQPFFVLLPDRG